MIESLFNPKKYEELNKYYGIDSSNIESLFLGYRYCLNCLSEITEDEDKIYSSLYDKNKISYLTEKCYPGSNPKDEPKYKLFNTIINHFIEKPNEGCYICLCEKGFYHSVLSGFPGDNEKDMYCPNCNQPIGVIYEETELGKEFKIVNRKDYMRILKDDEEIKNIKENEEKYKKLQQINNMTFQDFKTKYLDILFKQEKGLNRIEEKYFKKKDKLVRNMSQVLYRLLNYILYSHLFFARLYTGITTNFDKYLPKNLNWGETLNECWKLLKEELSDIGINVTEIFMNFTFKDLFNKLNSQECIDDYDDLIGFEVKLEEMIQKKIVLSQKECKKFTELIKNSDKNSFVNLLTEKYNIYIYDKEIFPNYDNFYYTDYLDEENIKKELNDKEMKKYPILKRYLEYFEIKKRNDNRKKKEVNNYSLDNLNLFITVLNLFSEKYSHLITREFAKTRVLENEDLYKINSSLIDKFIKYFNQLKILNEIKEKKEKNENIINKDDEIRKDDDKSNKDNAILKLSVKNNISDFLIDPENEYGKAYKKILQKFIENQNNELSDLLNSKIIEGTNEINIQQIKEDEIFTFNIPTKFVFINETSNSSYRKIIDDNDVKYNKYEINFDFIEEKFTNLLLKNKKLLKDDIIEFSYNNKIFSNEVSNVITTFKDNYKIEAITLEDKVNIYKLIEINKSNKDFYKKIIDDFMILISYLIKKNKNENVKISDINSKIENDISRDFFDFFKDKKELTIYKTLEIFKCFIKLIFTEIKDEINEFQEKKVDKKTEDLLNKYFEKGDADDDVANNNKKIINKVNLKSAIRWFMALVLFKESDKKNKIKANKINIFNYLNVKDLWDKKIYEDSRFEEDLNELKKLNIKINTIVWLYDYLTKGKEEENNYTKGLEDDILKNNLNQESKKEKEQEDEESEQSESDDGKKEGPNDSKIKNKSKITLKK